MLNQIDRTAFAAEQAHVQKEIDQRATAQWLAEADAPQRAKIQDLANDLGRAGCPLAAAHVIARRIVELEYKVSVQQVILDTRLPRHMQAVEKRA